MKTVKVRIAVAMQSDGDWNACGWRDADDAQVRGNVIDPMDKTARIEWGTADVPVPESIEISGTVEPLTKEAVKG